MVLREQTGSPRWSLRRGAFLRPAGGARAGPPALPGSGLGWGAHPNGLPSLPPAFGLVGQPPPWLRPRLLPGRRGLDELAVELGAAGAEVATAGRLLEGLGGQQADD